MNRRNFIKTSALAAGAAIATPATAQDKKSTLDLNFFTKPLQWMNYDQLAESVAEMGLNDGRLWRSLLK